MPPKKLEDTAYHEAGHAVARYLLGLRINHVTIIPEEGMLGHCDGGKGRRTFHPDINLNLRQRDYLEREVISTLAGGTAERRFGGQPNLKGSESDLHAAVDLASYVHGGGELLDAYVNYLWACAAAMWQVEWQWLAVKVLAAELLARRRIGGRKAREVIRGACHHDRIFLKKRPANSD